MVFQLTGLAAVLALVVFVVALAAPVWLAAKIVNARHPTLLRAVLSLAAGTLGCVLLALLTGPFVFFLAPIAYLLAFMLVLGTSFPGSVLLAVIAGLGYWALAHVAGSGVAPGAVPTVTV